MDNVCPKIAENIHTFRTKLPLLLCSTFTCPYYMIFHTHLEDKVDVWAAGSGKYGGVDGVVNGVVGVRDSMETPSDCEEGRKDIGNDYGGYGGCRLEFGGFARKILVHRGFLFFTTVMENFWAAGNPILWVDDSGENNSKYGGDRLEPMYVALNVEESLIRESVNLQLDLGPMGNFIRTLVVGTASNCCTLRVEAAFLLVLQNSISHGFTSEKLLQQKHGNSNAQISSNMEIQVKLRPRYGEDNNKHNKYLASSQNVRRQPTFCSDSPADYLISVFLTPSFIEIVRDYYPP